ncbi:hypothetical protein CVS40_11163 [Lucilia cuprina]|nr:hypothetical protein CVS40_11163 [Lucilia cuprina]
MDFLINIKIKLIEFVCDAPARAFLTGSVGHNALNGCSRCHQIGTLIENSTVFSSTSGEKRTMSHLDNG